MWVVLSLHSEDLFQVTIKYSTLSNISGEILYSSRQKNYIES